MNKIVEKYETNINNLSNNIYNNYDRDLRIGILDLENYLNSAFKEFKPNYIAEYIYNLCVLMNSFYQNNHISNLEDKEKLNVEILKLNKEITELKNRPVLSEEDAAVLKAENAKLKTECDKLKAMEQQVGAAMLDARLRSEELVKEAEEKASQGQETICRAGCADQEAV